MVTTEKKNQHYIPKFYLRNFSFHGNEKQIGVFNLNNQHFCPTAKLKTQGSKNFFYGRDGIVENKLSQTEGIFAKVLKNIIDSGDLPQKDTEEHWNLLKFVAFTELRNPVKIENTKSMFKEIQRSVLETDPKANLNEIFPSASHDEIIGLSLSSWTDIVKNSRDLDFKLLLNNTNSPFISSDFPVVKYNQYLQWRKWPQAKTGFGQTGLQIFFPLNSKMTIVFFDSGIYKVGNKKQKTYSINKTQDIDSINILQFVNCFETVYFDEKGTENYIRNLYLSSKKYKRANIVKSHETYLFENEAEKKELLDSKFKNLMILNTSDPETNLNIDAIKIHSNGRLHRLHPSMSQLRPYPSYLRDLRRAE